MKRDGCRVKICGITSLEDRDLVHRAGADYFGVIVDVPYSPRTMDIEAAALLLKNAPIPGIALIFQQNLRQIQQLVEFCQPQAVQFLSQLPFKQLQELKKSFPKVGWWQSLFLPAAGDTQGADPAFIKQQIQDLAGAGADAVILDTAVKASGEIRFGGTGRASNWKLAQALVEVSPLPVFLAGGIKPSNVRDALDMVHPDGIDLCSGIEAEPGRKDSKKLFDLMDQIRQWEMENKKG